MLGNECKPHSTLSRQQGVDPQSLSLNPGCAPGRRLRRLMARQHVHKPRARRAAEYRRRVRLGQVRVQRVRVELRQHVPVPTHHREVGAAQPGVNVCFSLGVAVRCLQACANTESKLGRRACGALQTAFLQQATHCIWPNLCK